MKLVMNSAAFVKALFNVEKRQLFNFLNDVGFNSTFKVVDPSFLNPFKRLALRAELKKYIKQYVDDGYTYLGPKVKFGVIIFKYDKFIGTRENIYVYKTEFPSANKLRSF